MIFVTVGTIHHPFDRMAGVVSRLVEDLQVKDKIVIQAGHTRNFIKYENVEISPFYDQEKIWLLMKQANLILMHGGEGSLIDAMEWSRYKPIIFPRDPSLGEHVDDYQREIGMAAMSRGWCTNVNSVAEAVVACQRYLKKPEKLPSTTMPWQNNQLIEYLNATINQDWLEK